MSDMKCPMCGTILDKALMNDKIRGCPKCRNMGNIELWQELIRTRKTLEQSETCCTEWEKQALDYKAENIALSGDLERTRKALDVAVDALKQLEKELYFNNAKQTGHIADSVMSIPSIALEQITALEQKE